MALLMPFYWSRRPDSNRRPIRVWCHGLSCQLSYVCMQWRALL